MKNHPMKFTQFKRFADHHGSSMPVPQIEITDNSPQKITGTAFFVSVIATLRQILYFLNKLRIFVTSYFVSLVKDSYSFILNYKQNDFSDLALESNEKSLKLAKTQALFGPLMLLLIGISNLLIISIGEFM